MISDHVMKLKFFLIYTFAGKKKGVKGGSSLPWSVRYKVAIGIAEAVAYLHNGTERCVVHRDIKPSNILLSSKKTPKVVAYFLLNFISVSHSTWSVVYTSRSDGLLCADCVHSYAILD